MDGKKKKVCRYGAKCYRKSETHLREYIHPTETLGSHKRDKHKHRTEKLQKHTTEKLQKRTENRNINTKAKKFDKVKQPVLELEKKRKASEDVTTDVKKVKKEEAEEKEIDEKREENPDASEEKDVSVNDVKSESWTYIKAPVEAKADTKDDKDSDTNEIIKSYYLVDMPPDFYSFFKFCESVNKNEPLNALKPFGLNLVGPFEILAGKDINLCDKRMILCHWRYYYDPPEFQTVLTSESGFHLGYWRDAPKNQPQFVAGNNSENCSFQIYGENIFGAVYNYLKRFTKATNPFKNAEVANFQVRIGKWAKENKFKWEKLAQIVKSRKKNINTKTFHGLGIVVPVQKKTNVGYRPLGESDENLRKICSLIVGAENKEKQDALMEKLQPLVTFANIANDECDFGNSLELGMDLFCMGSSLFHKLVEYLLTTAYNLLERSEFSTIIKIHLENRRTGKNMSVL